MTTSILTSNKSASNSFVHKYPLAFFFALVYALTWPFMIWDALASHDILPFRLPIPVMLIQSYMPTLAAVIVIELIQGRAGIRALFRKLLIARVGFRWHIFAIFGMAATSIAAILLGNLFGSSPALQIFSKEMPTGLSAVLLNATILFVVTGILNG
jgi:hypothetical protein